MANQYITLAHAKGIMLNGTFTPTPEAAKLSAAPHFNNPSTPVIVRFSNATAFPNIPDTDPNTESRGMTIRFTLGDHVHTDIVNQSSPLFPVKTGEELLELLKAVAASPPDAPSPKPIEKFLGAHPAALKQVTSPKPIPTSFAREAFWGVTAYKFIAADGTETFIRYRFVPEAGVESLDAEATKDKDPDFLQKELADRLKEGPVVFRMVAQIAEKEDITDDATNIWPESRQLVELGVVKLDAIIPDNAKEQQRLIFDPIPRVKGIEPSDDPLLEVRAAVYLLSGRERRAAS
jgi:catalase